MMDPGSRELGREFDWARTFEILERTPGVLRTWLTGLHPFWTRAEYGPDTFTVFDIVGHLIHGERADWMPRVRLILEAGPAQPFEPFDRYAQFEASHGKSLADLLDEFARLRSENLAALRRRQILHEQLRFRGTHPELGTVTLEQLLGTWVVHDLNHLAQIAKALATQYAGFVGPWREYLSILRTPVTPMDAAGAARARRARALDAREAGETG